MADYTFYYGIYGGTMPESDFNRLRARAAVLVEQATLGRYSAGRCSTAIENAANMAVCAVADVLYKEDNGGDVVSENNDGISRTYSVTGKSTEAQISAAIARHLAWTGLLYRGC